MQAMSLKELQEKRKAKVATADELERLHSYERDAQRRSRAQKLVESESVSNIPHLVHRFVRKAKQNDGLSAAELEQLYRYLAIRYGPNEFYADWPDADFEPTLFGECYPMIDAPSLCFELHCIREYARALGVADVQLGKETYREFYSRVWGAWAAKRFPAFNRRRQSFDTFEYDGNWTADINSAYEFRDGVDDLIRPEASQSLMPVPKS